MILLLQNAKIRLQQCHRKKCSTKRDYTVERFCLLFNGLTLLEIKSTLNDTKNVLSNWQEFDESPCAWTDITCHPGEQRVRSMYAMQAARSINLPYMQLGGIISPSIGRLSRLQRLYLRANYFQGGILETFHF